MHRIPLFVILLLTVSRSPDGLCSETNASLFGISLTAAEESEREAEIQFQKGHACFTGEGAEQDPGNAVEHYTRAAELGHPRAQFNLGLCHMNGTGVEQSDQEAVKWFRQAADQHVKEALYPLGLCYYNQEQYVEAYAWALLAEAQGDCRLKELLDPMYTEEEMAAGRKRFDAIQEMDTAEHQEKAADGLE